MIFEEWAKRAGYVLDYSTADMMRREAFAAGQRAMLEAEPVAYWDGCYSDPHFSMEKHSPGIGENAVRLYRLKEAAKP